MRIGSITRSLGVELAFGLFLAVLAAQPEPAFAQAPAAAPDAGGHAGPCLARRQRKTGSIHSRRDRLQTPAGGAGRRLGGDP